MTTHHPTATYSVASNRPSQPTPTRRAVLLGVSVWLALALPFRARATDDLLFVPRDATNYEIPLSTLLDNDGDRYLGPLQLISWSPPSHGQLVFSGETLTYFPGSELPRQGLDHFRYVFGNDSGTLGTAAVYLIADQRSFLIFSRPDGEPMIYVGHEAPQGGNVDIQVDGAINTATATISGEGTETSLAVAFDAMERAVYQAVQVTSDTGSWLEVRALEGCRTPPCTPLTRNLPPIPLPGSSFTLSLPWWIAKPGDCDGGLAILLDGMVQGLLEDLCNSSHPVLAWQLGDSTNATPSELQNLEIWGSWFQPPLPLHFADNFGTRDFEAWAQATLGDALQITSEMGELSPALGVTLTSDSPPAFLTSPSAFHHPRHRVRFRLEIPDTEGLSGQIEVLRAETAGDAPVYRVEIAGGPSPMARASVIDGDHWLNLPWAPLPETSGSWEIEVGWRAESTPGSSDSQLSLSIDRQSSGFLVGRSSAATAVERIRFGAVSILEGAQGTYLLDELVAWH